MNKAQLIKEVSYDTGCNNALCERIVNSILDNIVCELAKGNSVNLSEFGMFTPKYRKNRTRRNLNAGEFVPISTRVTPAFKAGKLLKGAVIDDK